MFAAPILIDRLMTNYSAGVSGNGNRIKSKMAAKYRDKRTFITTVLEQYPLYDIFPTHLIFHYPLPLKVVGNEKEGGSGRWQRIGIGLGPRRSIFFWLLILLSSLF
jgi:hypothetical protein